MADTRSGQVVFVSHCLLNQNTRYLGGAVCRGVVSAAICSDLEDGTGDRPHAVSRNRDRQMPCPEQRVWGGVLKTRMLWLEPVGACASTSRASTGRRSAAGTGVDVERVGRACTGRPFATVARRPVRK
jgi:hypothetical protein